MHWSKTSKREEVIRKIIIKKTGVKQSKETVEKRRLKLVGKKRKKETLIKMSLSQKGKPKWTDEQKKQISERQKGKKKSEETKRKMSWSAKKEEKSHNWKGDAVKYRGLHAWVRRQLGDPKKCEHCRKDGLMNRHIHWANKSGEYKRDISDWIRLCVSCHLKYDKVYLKRQRDYYGKFI